MSVLGAIIGIIPASISIIISSFFLWIAFKIFSLKEDSYLTALKISAIVGAVGYVLSLFMKGWLSFLLLLLNLALSTWLIKKFEKESWGKSVLVMIVWFVMSTIVVALFILIAILLIGSSFYTLLAISGAA